MMSVFPENHQFTSLNNTEIETPVLSVELWNRLKNAFITNAQKNHARRT
jgi:hypothetical protein